MELAKWMRVNGTCYCPLRRGKVLFLLHSTLPELATCWSQQRRVFAERIKEAVDFVGSIPEQIDMALYQLCFLSAKTATTTEEVVQDKELSLG